MKTRSPSLAAFALLLVWFMPGALGQTEPYRWTKFVQVEGQPEPVPEEWVSTPEGRFAHSLRIPNPVPKDSGYRWTMSAKEYFKHLCKTEAGEFIFRKVDDVEGLYFARPPRRPTDTELMSRYRLEAPELERFFQLLSATPSERSLIFVRRSSASFRFVEEPLGPNSERAVRAFGFSDIVTPRPVKEVERPTSRFALTWRGLRRPNDREHAIAGSEWIVFERETSIVFGVLRSFGMSPKTVNVQGGIWWLNATPCPSARYASSTARAGDRLFEFVSNVLRPSQEEAQ